MQRLDTASPQLVGLMLLVSRLTSEISAARCTTRSGQADWLAKLNAEVQGDIAAFDVPGASDEVKTAIKENAKGAVQFVLGRLAFEPNA